MSPILAELPLGLTVLGDPTLRLLSAGSSGASRRGREQIDQIVLTLPLRLVPTELGERVRAC